MLSLLVFLLTILNLLFPAAASASQHIIQGKKVLAVMSYGPDNGSESETRRGLTTRLKNQVVKYIFLDTRKHLNQGAKRAREAYKEYKKFQPDAVVAANDNAQRLFVLPYLKDREQVPVIFCGVNNEAGKYGYPTALITGVLEKKRYNESIGFAQVIVPGIKHLGVIYKNNPTNKINIARIEEEKDRYPTRITAIRAVETLKEAKMVMREFNHTVDAVLILNLTGIKDDSGRPLNSRQVMNRVLSVCRRPTIATELWEVKSGVLCGVVHSSRAQGEQAADFLYQIWQGTAIENLPLIENHNDRRYLNITTLKQLGLPLSTMAAVGTRIITTHQ